MSHTTLDSKAFKPAPVLEVSAEIRDLVAALPIVILVKALRAAFARGGMRTALKTQTA
jgi:hypothetical protein